MGLLDTALVRCRLTGGCRKWAWGGGGEGAKIKERGKNEQTYKNEHEIFARKLVRASIFPLFFHHFFVDDQWEEFKTRDEGFAVQTCFL